jgi:RNA polymerase sigma-70 factor (ECF subfamily)
MTDTVDPTSEAALIDLRAGLRLMALVRLKNAEAAEEATQESMVRVLDAIRQNRLEDRSRLGAFARGIAHHVIVDMQRARARMLPMDEGDQRMAVPDLDALSLLVTTEESGRVRAAMAALSSSDQEVLRFSFYEELTPSALGERLGEPAERIRKRKQRALERLRAAFFGAGGHAAPTPSTGEQRGAVTAPREDRE